MIEYGVIARQLAGVPVDTSEIDALPEPGRSIARRLIGANGNGPEIFKKALDEFIPDVGERQSFYHAVLSADPAADPATAPLSILTADNLLTTAWPEPVVIVPDILTAGLGILAGKAKLGKSWLALQALLSVTSGGICLGRKVERGPALYCALEDSPRRLADRMKKQGWPRGLPADFLTIGEFPKQVGDLLKGGADKLARQIASRGYRLVVIDTLSRAVAGNPNKNDEMTRALTPLQEMAHKMNCNVLLVDHHAKAEHIDGPDAVTDILGSTAKGAMADVVLGLYRQRGKAGAKLAVTGRELPELTLALNMDWVTGCWQCEGDADALALTERRQEIISALAEIGHPATAAEVAKLLDQDRGNTFKRLQDLATGGMVNRLSESGKAAVYVLP